MSSPAHLESLVIGHHTAGVAVMIQGVLKVIQRLAEVGVRAAVDAIQLAEVVDERRDGQVGLRLDGLSLDQVLWRVKNLNRS